MCHQATIYRVQVFTNLIHNYLMLPCLVNLQCQVFRKKQVQRMAFEDSRRRQYLYEKATFGPYTQTRESIASLAPGPDVSFAPQSSEFEPETITAGATEGV
jgi:hypothetical protein